MVLSSLHEVELPPRQVDLIASHGQTIYHAPKSLHHLPDYPNATLQLVTVTTLPCVRALSP
jgi:anhydro-N-acetylmuramic acid kinase